MQRQGRSGAEARKAPEASPSLAQPAPSWAGSRAARQAWARLAQGRGDSRQQLCHIGPLSRAGALPYWRRPGAQASRARATRGWAASSSLEEARLPLLFTRLPGGGALRLLQVLAQASRAFSLKGLGSLLFPRGGSLPCWLCTRQSGEVAGLLQQVLPQGLLALSWGCGREPRHAGAGPNQLHTSLLGRRALGKLRV